MREDLDDALRASGSEDHGCLVFAKFQTSGDYSKIQISSERLKHGIFSVICHIQKQACANNFIPTIFTTL